MRDMRVYVVLTAPALQQAAATLRASLCKRHRYRHKCAQSHSVWYVASYMSWGCGRQLRIVHKGTSPVHHT